MAFNLSVLFVFLSICLKLARAKDYTVGDDQGWTSSYDYLTWSHEYNFTVGDVLVFNYIKGQHNVHQVTEDTFRSCNPASGVKATYTSGDDHVSLTAPGKYWFICTVKLHCKGGMRFGISVAGKAPTALGPAAFDFDAPPPPPPPPVVGGGGVAGGAVRRRRGWFGGVILAFVLTQLFAI